MATIDHARLERQARLSFNPIDGWPRQRQLLTLGVTDFISWEPGTGVRGDAIKMLTEASLAISTLDR